MQESAADILQGRVAAEVPAVFVHPAAGQGTVADPDLVAALAVPGPVVVLAARGLEDLVVPVVRADLCHRRHRRADLTETLALAVHDHPEEGAAALALFWPLS